jgi:hypothetical protein
VDVGAATHAAALALLVRAMFFSDLDPQTTRHDQGCHRAGRRGWAPRPRRWQGRRGRSSSRWRPGARGRRGGAQRGRSWATVQIRVVSWSVCELNDSRCVLNGK